MPDQFNNFEKKYGALLKKEIPTFKRVQPSLITILKAYGETNLSNLLGYLFRGEDHPLLKEIFLRALLALFDFDPDFPRDDAIEDYLDDIVVELETFTRFGGRIDILIRRKHKQPSERWAVIVENKLHHTLDNDLHDYFYSTGTKWGIWPKNIAVIVLALKETPVGKHPELKLQLITHDRLKREVAQLRSEHEAELDAPAARLLVSEYLRHIDDMYLNSGSEGNEAALDFFATHRALINQLCREAQPAAQQPQVEPLRRLQNEVLLHMDRVFQHYLERNYRNIGGSSEARYFRGSGASYDLIRYQLDHAGYYNGTKPNLEFKVWLNGSRLKLIGFDVADPAFQRALAKAGASLPVGKQEWAEICVKLTQPSHARIQGLLKEHLNTAWLALEELLAAAYDGYVAEQVYSELMPLLQAAGYHCKISDDGLTFADVLAEPLLRFKTTFIAPDYTEITLYVEQGSWDNCKDLIRGQALIKDFIFFDNHQSWHVPELTLEGWDQTAYHYEAFAKRSFRERDQDKLLDRVSAELIQFKQLEVTLTQGFFKA